MNRRLLLLGFFALWTPFALATIDPPSPRPNILFILTDQERFFPHLPSAFPFPGHDRLSKMGTTFQNHQISATMCTSSRSVMLTGLPGQTTPMADQFMEDLFDPIVRGVFEQVLRAGYAGPLSLEVFNDVPVVPRQACSVVIDYPTTADEQERYMQSPDSHPTREEVENGTIRLAAFRVIEPALQLAVPVLLHTALESALVPPLASVEVPELVSVPPDTVPPDQLKPPVTVTPPLNGRLPDERVRLVTESGAATLAVPPATLSVRPAGSVSGALKLAV